MADIPFGEATMPVVISNDINGYLAQVSSTGAIYTRVEPLGDTVEHFNGTATTGNTTLTFAAYSKSICLHNTGSNNLLVSFDGGVNFKTLAPGISLAMEVRRTSFIQKSNTGTTTYEHLIVE
jgi:hypothetical protein